MPITHYLGGAYQGIADNPAVNPQLAGCGHPAGSPGTTWLWPLPSVLITLIAKSFEAFAALAVPQFPQRSRGPACPLHPLGWDGLGSPGGPQVHRPPARAAGDKILLLPLLSLLMSPSPLELGMLGMLGMPRYPRFPWQPQRCAAGLVQGEGGKCPNPPLSPCPPRPARGKPSPAPQPKGSRALSSR